MNISETPILDSSRTYNAYVDTTVSPREYVVVISASDAETLDRVDDIWLSYIAPSLCLPREVSLWDLPENDWRIIDSHPGGSVCFGLGHATRLLLSRFSDDPRSQYLADKVLRLRGTLSSPQLRLIQYRDDYDFVALSEGLSLSYESLVFDGESIWASTTTVNGDSITAFDMNGNRLRSMYLAGVHSHGAAWDGNQFWLLLSHTPPRFATLSPDGIIRIAFDLPESYQSDVRGGIAWMDSLIWMPRSGGASSPSGMSMIAIDPKASLESGTGVIVDDVPTPTEFSTMLGIATVDDELLVITGYPWQTEKQMFRISRDGQIRTAGSVKLSAGPIAWDGESLWMLHSGPSSASSRGVFLSRFTLP